MDRVIALLTLKLRFKELTYLCALIIVLSINQDTYYTLKLGALRHTEVTVSIIPWNGDITRQARSKGVRNAWMYYCLSMVNLQNNVFVCRKMRCLCEKFLRRAQHSRYTFLNLCLTVHTSTSHFNYAKHLTNVSRKIKYTIVQRSVLKS